MNEWKGLRVWAEMYEDVQKTRIAATNRAKRGGVDSESYDAQLATLEVAEGEFAKALRREYRRIVPEGIRQWQQETIGIGEHMLARLLGVVGHPVHATPHHWEGEGRGNRVLVADEPFDRTVSQFWAYCGHGDPTRKRRKGMNADEALSLGNPRAKMLAHLMAELCIRQMRSPYRRVYDEARAQYETRDWTDLHRHNAALRKVAKEILRDLWLAANDAT